MKRRLSLFLVAILLFSSSLIGCQSGNNSTSTPTNGTTPAVATGTIIYRNDAAGTKLTDNTPENGFPVTAVPDTLTVALASEPGGLHIMQFSDGAAAIVTCAFGEGLLMRDNETFEYIPMLAKSWERIDDLTVRFYLRDDVIFHNGERMTADDVLFMFERGLELSARRWIYTPFDLEKCKIVDEFTFDAVTKTPFAPLFAYLSDPGDCVMSRKAVESTTLEMYARNANGAAGPYKFVEWIAGDRIVLERHDEYYGEKPEFKYIVFRIITDATARTLAFEAGDVDIVMNPLISSVETLRKNPNCDVWSVDDFITTNIVLNNDNPILGNKTVREAMAYALDIPSIANIAFGGTGRVSYSIFPPQIPGNHDPDPVNNAALLEYNPEKAKQLLEEAGYPDGFSLNVYSNENQNRIDISEMLQNYWGAVGINCEVKIMEFAALIELYGNGEHEAMVNGYVPSGTDGDFLYSIITSSNGYSSNYNAINNPEVDELMLRARGLMDNDERIAIYSRVIDILREEVYYIPIHNSETFYGVRSTLTNFEANPQQQPHLWSVRSKAQ